MKYSSEHADTKELINLCKNTVVQKRFSNAETKTNWMYTWFIQ